MYVNDLIFTNILMNSVGKINTGYLIIDILYIMILSYIMLIFNQGDFKYILNRKFKSIFSKFNKTILRS